VIRSATRRSAEIAGEYGVLLSRRISVALLAALGALWVSGVAWLLLHYVWATPGEFGAIRHPLEGPTLLMHGVIALLALFLLGWFAGRHPRAATSGRRLASGWLLTVLTGVLVAAGCAQLFLTSAAWQSRVALVHEVLGAMLVLPLLAHGWYSSAARRERDRVRAPDAPRGGRSPLRGPRNARS
jgi:uncharacterized membrane protein YeaQ/YmgE (transglycosylase-associated protein family)